jgi:hypothetical protein
MKLQIVHDEQGKNTGVFIPIEVWTIIKNQYPDIENADSDLLQWEKDLIDTRLEAITQNQARIQPGKNLLTALKRKI